MKNSNSDLELTYFNKWSLVEASYIVSVLSVFGLSVCLSVSTDAGITEATGPGIAGPDSGVGSTVPVVDTGIPVPRGRRIDGVIGLNTKQGRAVYSDEDGQPMGRAVHPGNDSTGRADDPDTRAAQQQTDDDSGNLITIIIPVTL